MAKARAAARNPAPKGKANQASAITARVSDESVAAKTGKTWAQWFAALDRAGAAKLPHKEIAALLHERHGLSGWWAQTVTVGYEQARLGRAPHQKPGGFEISVTKTVAVSVERLFAAWNDAKRRSRWLGERIEVRRATPPKSLRATWPDGTALDVAFLAKGEEKSQVAVAHGKLKDAISAQRAKSEWTDRLTRLKAYLEKG